MKTASAPSLWGKPGRAPAPGAETHLRARRESGQTCLGMMQGRSQIPTSQIARGRPGPRDPLVGGCEPRTPPSTWERGQSREWGGAEECGPRTGRTGPAHLPSSGRPGPAPGQPPAPGPGPRGGRCSRCLRTRTGAQPRPRVPVRPPSLRSRGPLVGYINAGPEDAGGPRLRTRQPSRTYHRPGSAPHLGVFIMQCSQLQSAVAAPQHLWPQSQPSPYLLPAPPSPAPSLRLRPLPPSLGPGRFRPASRRRVAPTPVRQGRSSGGVGAAALGPANQICSVRVGPHLTLPLRNSVQRELSVTEVSAPGEGWGGNKRRYT